LQKLKEAQVQNTELKRSLKEYQELDPDELEKLKAESQVSLSCVSSFFFHSIISIAFTGFFGGCEPLDR
jgi:hypothetical protein